jgi:hypothetical protein
MYECASRLRHYGDKCQQHLNRVRLSHLIALTSLAAGASSWSDEQRDLAEASFDGKSPVIQEDKLRRGLSEVHLIALKANFELYLNRVVTTLWNSRFEELATKCPEDVRVSSRDLASLLAEDNDTAAAAKEAILLRLVPPHGLCSLARALECATGIKLQALLGKVNANHWPQIRVAFQVRHLVEHRDGKVDSRFRNAVGVKLWVASSWGRQPLEDLQKVRVEPTDVAATYEAMIAATELLADQLRHRYPA